MPVMHYVVTLFGTNSYDGLSISTYTFETPPTSSLIILISQHSPYKHNLFLSPTPENPPDTPIKSFNLRCYSPETETPVPPFAGFAAAHVLFHQHRIEADKLVIMENNQRLEFPRTIGQIRCHVCLTPTRFDLPVGNTERILLMDIFGIVRRDLVLEYVENCRTLVIYDLAFDVDRIKRLSPGHNKRYSRMSMMTTDVLDMDYVALCVADKRSGGVYVRGLRPMSGYSDVDVPLAVLPYLKNVSLFDRDTGVYSGFPSSMFEITWMAKGKECRLIKTCLDNGYPSNSNVTKALLIAEATTIQAAQV